MKKVFKELAPSIDSSFIVKEEKAAQFAAPFHFHDAYEFTFIVKGQGKFYGGNQVMNFADNDIYFFGPLYTHYFVNEKSFLEAGRRGHSVIVQFQEDFLGKDFFQKPEFQKIRNLFSSARSGLKINTHDPDLKGLFFRLLQQKGARRIILLLDLLEKASSLPADDLKILSIPHPQASGKMEGKKEVSKLDAVYRYVLENFKEDVTTQKAASLACFNETAFCRYFKRQTKLTFSQFVSQVRVIHATSLLQEKNLSVAEVCYESGFNNISYFNRQFKKLINISPLQYRKLY